MALAARIAAAVLSLGMMAGDKRHVERQAEKTEREQENRREDNAENMEATLDALKSASISGQTLARAVPVSELNKLAFGAFMGAMGTLAGKAVGAMPGAKGLVGALTPGWKTKALGLAGIAGVGYAGYKGLSALRDYASKPVGGEEWGSKRPLMHNVNEWGQPSF